MGVWEGNFSKALACIAPHNDQMMVRVQGKKLIIKDKKLQFFAAIPFGDEIEIPVYYEQLPCGAICPASQISEELRELRVLLDENSQSNAVSVDAPEERQEARQEPEASGLRMWEGGTHFPTRTEWSPECWLDVSQLRSSDSEV